MREFAGAKAAMITGGQIQELSFTLRHPEIMLCDLSNLDAPLSSWPISAVEGAYAAIDRALDEWPRPRTITRISGDDLRPELAVSAPTYDELIIWRAEFLQRVLAPFGRPIDVGARAPRGLQRSQSLVAADERTQRHVRQFAQFYSRFVHPAYWADHPALNLRRLYAQHPIWLDIAALPGRKLFVLSAGLALGVSYASATGDFDIYFTEHHRQNDPNQLSRVENFTDIYPAPPAATEWVIIDKAYSGGTIDAAVATLQAGFGSSLKTIKVALFPKSLEAVRRSDYFVYAGRLFETAEIVDDLSADHWHVELLRAAL